MASGGGGGVIIPVKSHVFHTPDNGTKKSLTSLDDIPIFRMLWNQAAVCRLKASDGTHTHTMAKWHSSTDQYIDKKAVSIYMNFFIEQVYTCYQCAMHSIAIAVFRVFYVLNTCTPRNFDTELICLSFLVTTLKSLLELGPVSLPFILWSTIQNIVGYNFGHKFTKFWFMDHWPSFFPFFEQNLKQVFFCSCWKKLLAERMNNSGNDFEKNLWVFSLILKQHSQV